MGSRGVGARALRQRLVARAQTNKQPNTHTSSPPRIALDGVVTVVDAVNIGRHLDKARPGASF